MTIRWSREPPCPACNRFPCQGSHIHCDVELYASHRGLTVEQLYQRAVFEQRREVNALKKIMGESLLADLKRAFGPGPKDTK